MLRVQVLFQDVTYRILRDKPTSLHDKTATDITQFVCPLALSRLQVPFTSKGLTRKIDRQVNSALLAGLFPHSELRKSARHSCNLGFTTPASVPHWPQDCRTLVHITTNLSQQLDKDSRQGTSHQHQGLADGASSNSLLPRERCTRFAVAPKRWRRSDDVSAVH
jgi:hypothetical protein